MARNPFFFELRVFSTWWRPVPSSAGEFCSKIEMGLLRRQFDIFWTFEDVTSIFKMTTPNKTPPGADPKQLERTGTVREIGSQAVWSLSSCKPGFGVDQLRDDNLETYWQSDGSQPHLVNIQFRRKTTVKTLCIYADYKSDESYTPSKISVRVGNNFHNLQEIRQLELVEPSGWIHVPLTDNHKKPTRTFMIQIAVLANHQNGRDTHMRQIKIYTPVEESSIGKFPRCTTIDFMMYRSIR
ncbi:anaphase-promoting complex subunit 10 isoform X4 [Bubalus bubalis]|uniref:anaphase-promoting complex subunit 10 isoform X4 n=1 Tax=Bubalus bubalis TaxID=89462 RepID=UPI001D0FB202|nr:anaphase-promoting complex subunit 10 isoform X4 [Bubalus bubalis]